MIATIESVSGKGAEMIVAFKSTVGSGKARWSGPQEAPRIGAAYDVELDVWEPFEVAPARSTVGIELVDNRVLLTGVIESIDEDEVSCLRIAPDCMMMFEKGKHKFSIDARVTLRLEIEKFELTPFGLHR